MRFYARPSLRLARQIASDLFVLLWAFVWWGVGRFVDGSIRALAEPARRARELAAQLRQQATDAATQAGGVPMVGDGLRQPFDGMAGTLRDLATAASDQVAQVEQVATVVGWVVFLIPVLGLVAVWLPRRLRFARRAQEVLDLVQTADGTQLLALRALANRSLGELQRVAPDPMSGWRAGDPRTIDALAELELADAGVTRPRPRGNGAASIER